METYKFPYIIANHPAYDILVGLLIHTIWCEIQWISVYNKQFSELVGHASYDLEQDSSNKLHLKTYFVSLLCLEPKAFWGYLY